MSKRGREPDKAPEQTNKQRRVLKTSQPLDPAPPRHVLDPKQEDLRRPGPSSYQARQAALHHHHPAPSPSQQSEQGGRPGLHQRSPSPPDVQLPSAQPGEGRRGHPKLRMNPPRLQGVPAPSQARPIDPESSDSDTSTCYSQGREAYDVGQDVRDVGTPQDGDIESWGAGPEAQFIRSRSGLDGNWVGVRPLGRGSYGIAGLWELRGLDGQVKKQMVVKEISESRDFWMKYSHIIDEPKEVKIMSYLNKTHCHAIPRLYDYKRYPHAYKYRMYMEFCPHEDLAKLCNRYRKFGQHLPEEFLWDTFYHLVEAAVAMKSGTGDWDFEIVHRDIKPDNVFLGEVNEEKGFPFYPVAKLGDFGLAVMTNHKDDLNPGHYQWSGTPAYAAPEQVHHEPPQEKQHQLSTYTNIWAIGATMLELLTLYRHSTFMGDPDWNVDGMVSKLYTAKEPDYSEELKTLIEECVWPEPHLRITLRDLRSRIKSYRKRMRREYKRESDSGRETFRARHRLYTENELNDMPEGNWVPPRTRARSLPRSEAGRLPDGHLGTAPENAIDHDAALPTGALEERQQREDIQRRDAAPRSKGHRLSDPIRISDDTTKSTNDSSITRRRKATRHPPPVRGQSSHDDRKSSSRRPDDDLRVGTAGADDEASIDGSQAMDLEEEDPPSPPPPSSSRQVTAPAPAPVWKD